MNRSTSRPCHLQYLSCNISGISLTYTDFTYFKDGGDGSEKGAGG